MFKKYKIKKRKKIINPYLIFSILAIFLLLISYSYALLSDTIFIKGFANIISQNESNYEYGNSTYTYENRYNWRGNNGCYIYDIYVSVKNLDKDYTSYVVITFDTDSDISTELVSNNCNIWQAESVTSSNGHVTVKFAQYTSWIPYGNTIDLYFQLPFLTEKNNVEIKNLALNGLYARCLNSNQEIEPIDNSITTNTTIVENIIVADEPTNTTTSNTIVDNTTNTVSGNTVSNTIAEPEPEEPKPSGNSTYAYNIDAHWGTTYAVSIPINYQGDDISSWTISFNVPDGLIVDSSVFYQCESLSLSGNTLTLHPYGWAANVSNGSTISLSGQLTFETEVDFSITNLSINGASVSYGN